MKNGLKRRRLKQVPALIELHERRLKAVNEVRWRLHKAAFFNEAFEYMRRSCAPVQVTFTISKEDGLITTINGQAVVKQNDQ